ncbi:alpha/beta fold hydrolase [Kocuria kalidii]|uniref:alpha/beta fold hydrolase n=1 Tax=Kocuria kalidii TaxID=3376283 RepID=UPI0037A32D75
MDHDPQGGLTSSAGAGPSPEPAPPREEDRQQPALVGRRVAVGPLAVDVRGTFDPALPPVVLVHGIGVSGRYFLRLAGELAGSHDVYALDLPGSGTTPTPRRPLTVAELGDVVATVVAQLGLDAPVVVGHSMGCQIAVHTVKDHPGLCSAYVLLSPALDPEARGLLVQAGRLLRDAVREPLDTLAVVVRSYLRMGPVRFLRTARCLLHDRIEENIRRCPVPGLVVRGEDDPVSRRDWARHLARSAPDARFLEIPGAAHAVQHTRPEEVAAACARFVAAHGRDARPGRSPLPGLRGRGAWTPGRRARARSSRGGGGGRSR